MISEQHKAQTAILDVSFGGYSSAGVKPENQDAFVAQQPSANVRIHKGSVACIADGVSCSDDAQQASQLAVTTFVQDYISTPDSWSVKQSVSKVLSALNSWLFHHSKSAAYRQNSMVTTLSALVFKSNTAHICHVGDSRIYVYREGKLRQLTRDHLQPRNHEEHYLSRGVGMDSHLEVDYQSVDMQLGDKFVLTTDGVHNYVGNRDIEQILAGDLSLKAQSKAICDLALKHQSSDNLTCLICQIEHLPTQDINEISRQLTALKVPPVLSEGMKLEGFEIQQVLHGGNRSQVYLAKWLATGKTYVLKMPTPQRSDDLSYLEDFTREFWIGSRIQNSLVMKIHNKADFVPSSLFLYHICEYIEGQTLRQWMYDNPQPELRLVRQLAREMIASVRVLQRQGMVHRDLKPENFIVTPDGKLKLIDFGTVQVSGLREIESILQSQTPAGAVGYIAPEYLLGQQGVHRSDIFSLGVIIYEMLTGELPYKTPVILRNRVERLDYWQYRSAIKFRPDLPTWIDLVLKKATEPNIKYRYPAMSEMLADLSTPNQTLVNKLEAAPLIERNPLAFWKILSGVLALGLIIQTIFHNT